ncbi:hypothetical protein FDP41_010319 [Naegleria fowleri]|uniref:Uncharacterized protein n=1 Tax=Naegleria fowleri TaxID=5763 RepID=A0A6A5C9P1_NAEFO|nr:uncharacterized protein FDP41_010319 [Naegleria fowleri]KAF0983254.1 hypothetical protein FDP41_010319 [Naegleria fowleri]
MAVIDHSALFIQAESSESSSFRNETTTSSSFPVVMDHFIYPAQECLNLAPVNQFYYPFLYTYDTKYYDFCKMNDPQAVPSEIYKSGFITVEESDNSSSSSSCVNILCSTDTRWDLTNQTQLTLLGVLFNHCLHCNNSNSEWFRQVLRNHSCPTFTTSASLINSSQDEDFVSKFTAISQYHCNHETADSTTSSNPQRMRHLGLFDYNILTSQYFRKTFLDYSKNNNLFNQTGTFGDANAALKSVSLSTLFNFYFHDLFDKMDSNELPSAPLNVPISCWCNYESENGKSFGFQCNDFYQNWQIMFAYRISTVIFAVLYAVVTLMLVLFITIPKTFERIVSFKKRADVSLESSTFKKMLLFVRHYFDIATQPPPFFAAAAFSGFVENFLRCLFNYNAFLPMLKSAYFPGFFRGLAAILIICGYSSLVVSWSHVIDLSKRTIEKRGKGLSKFNMTILSIFYCAVIVVAFITVVVFLSVRNYAVAWIVLTFSVLIYLLTFVVGFTFYGVKIFFALRATAQEKKNFMEYRFTKFILFVTGIFFIGWFISLGMLVTYVFGYDALSLFLGISRNQFMDAGLNAVLIVSSYITFSDTCFEMTYGKKATLVLNHVLSCGSRIVQNHLKRDRHESSSSQAPQKESPTNFNQSAVVVAVVVDENSCLKKESSHSNSIEDKHQLV